VSECSTIGNINGQLFFFAPTDFRFFNKLKELTHVTGFVVHGHILAKIFAIWYFCCNY